MVKAFWKTCITGLILIVPAWATLLILSTLFRTLDNVVGRYLVDPLPGLGLLFLVLLVILIGVIGDHMIGRGLFERLEQRIEQIPLVQSIYLTLKGMTDLVNFRSRFGQSRVVAFPFPRDGCWALGFIMGPAPSALQVDTSHTLVMVFVPTAIHPFTGYLAFIPETALNPINLPFEEAMKMEFSAGFYRPRAGWLTTSPATLPRS